MTHLQYPSANGEHDIHALLWEPQRDPWAILQISHGMSEYAERYDDFAKFLAEWGVAVCANDHAGHGDSIRKTRGYFGAKDGDRILIEDMHSLYASVHQKFPELPYFLLGHSMGSFLARSYCAQYGKELNGAIFSGTGDAPGILPVALLLSKLAIRFAGGSVEGKLFYALSASGYNKKFKPNRTGSDWLTRDETLVDVFLSDQRSKFIFTNAGYGDLFHVLRTISRPAWAHSLPKELPILLFSGSEDPVGDGGRGVFTVFRRLVDAGIADVTLKLYGQGRHEMLNELNRREVYEDVYQWLLDRVH